MQFPLVEIIVPTYNRPNDIERFVEEIQKQTYPNFKVIIVDDCSENSVKNLIPADEKFVFIQLEQNEGQASARNHALRICKGEIVVSMDDDAWFMSGEDSLAVMVNYFLNNKDLGCLMFDIDTPGQPLLSEINKLNDSQQIGTHITCGCAYRTSVLMEIGGFPGFFHSGAEESDITFKILNKGLSIYFGKQILVFHNYIASNRDNNWYRKLRHNTTRNDLLLVVMYYPGIYIIPFFFGKWLSHIIYTLKFKRDLPISLWFTFKAIFSAIGMLNIAIKRRDSLSNGRFREWLKIRF